MERANFWIERFPVACGQVVDRKIAEVWILCKDLGDLAIERLAKELVTYPGSEYRFS